MTGVNFIPRERVNRRLRQRRMMLLGVVLATYAGVVGVGALLVHGPAAESAGRSKSRAREAMASADESQARRRATMEQVVHKSRLLEASRIVGVHPDWSILLGRISALRGGRLALTEIEILHVAETKPAASRTAAKPQASAHGAAAQGSSPEGAAERMREPEQYDLKLAGVAVSQTDLTGFIRRLEDLGPLRAVTVIDARAVKLAGGEVTNFEVRCRVGELEKNPAAKGVAP